MDALAAEVEALRMAVQHHRRGSSSTSSDRKRKKRKDKKAKKKDDERKSRKKKRSSSSSSSSGSSRERGKSRSPLRWRKSGRNKTVSGGQLQALNGMKFKKRGDLLAFASSHPGALAAGFLSEIHQRCGLGPIRQSSDLRKPSARAWAADKTGLSDIRDLREVATLATVVDHLNLDEAAEALDVIAQRIAAIQIAKTKGSTWERAQQSELIATGSHLVAPSGVIQLTK